MVPRGGDVACFGVPTQCGPTTVDGDHCAGDQAGVGRQQVVDHGGDLLRPSGTAQGVQQRECLAEGRVVTIGDD